MQVDAFAIRLRSRSNLEAADLGARMCQSAARSVYPCFFVAAVPVVLLSLALMEINDWLSTLVLWMAKPWLDRTILFVLARAAFGQATSVAQLWRAQRDVWWRQFLSTWTLRRLSPWRSLTQPVYQLEGHSWWQLRKRVRLIRARTSGSGLLMTSAFSMVELVFAIALLSLIFWLTPSIEDVSIMQTIAESDSSPLFSVASTLAYAMVVLFLEPFYVAAGFAMYLNRRVELEAWDIEQEFRRAFAH